MQRRPPLIPGGPSGGHGHSHGGIPGGGNKVPNSLQLDYDRRRKVAIKCLELEEMLMSQGFSQQEIEAKVTSFRNLLLVAKQLRPRQQFMGHKDFRLSPIQLQQHLLQ